MRLTKCIFTCASIVVLSFRYVPICTRVLLSHGLVFERDMVVNHEKRCKRLTQHLQGAMEKLMEQSFGDRKAWSNAHSVFNFYLAIA